MPTYYKALDAKGRSCHGGTLKWSLPRWNAKAQTWTPGKWMPKIDGEIVACDNGYHAAKGTTQLLDWLHDRTYIIESQSEWIDADNKVVTAGPVRLIAGTAWDDRTARLFAVACALDVLPLYEKTSPGDPRVSDALVVAWRYAYGDATRDELSAAGVAAGAVAWEAAGVVAGDVAREAARKAQATRLDRFLTEGPDL